MKKRRGITRPRAVVVALVAACIAASFLASGALPAGAAPTRPAQTCEYPFCPPPPPILPDEACNLSVETGAPGTQTTATVTNVVAGTPIDIVFDGKTVGSGTADVNGVAVIPFTVPNVPAGSYHVYAVGPGVNVQCDNPAYIVSARDTSRGGRSFGVTGFNLFAFLLVAVVLLAVGRSFLEASRRRRRHAERAAARRRAAGRASVNS